MPKLVLKFDAAFIKEYPVTSQMVTVGREPDNDIVIDHPAVSRHHCRVMLQGDTYFVEDLNSTNGTMVNGKKIIKAGIHNNDSINIAKHSITLVDDRPITAEAIAAAQQASAPAAEPATPAASAPASESSPNKGKQFEKLGGLRVTDGVVDQMEYQLTENSTYIGKSDRVTIKIKGMFAPEVAAMINRKPSGYALVAIKEGYPKVNGVPVQGERLLNEGDSIEVGGTVLQFYLKSS